MRAKIGPTSPDDGWLLLFSLGVRVGVGECFVFFFILLEPCLYDCLFVSLFQCMSVCFYFVFPSFLFYFIFLHFFFSYSRLALSLFILMFTFHV